MKKRVILRTYVSGLLELCVEEGKKERLLAFGMEEKTKDYLRLIARAMSQRNGFSVVELERQERDRALERLVALNIARDGGLA